MSKTSPAGRSRPSMPDLDLLATQTGLVIRKSSKFSPGGFLQSLLSSVATGMASLNQIAGDLKDRVAAPMLRQSLHERFDMRSTAFLLAVLGDLMVQRFKPAAGALEPTAIRRIIIEDASGQVMPKSNAESFPAHGNHHGATAGVKIDLAYDLLAGTVVSHSLQAATTQDKTIGGELVAEIRRGDLVLRDMGYFSLAEFTAIEACGAWWLTRLPLTTGVVLENGRPLEKLLEIRRHSIHDLGVIVGEQGKKCRLIAVRAAPEVAAARRAERHKRARETGRKACPKGLVRDGWHLMLTNLEKAQAGAAQLVAVYRARWAIEIQFRAWKQSLNLTKALNRKSGEHHMQALVLAAMIAHQLGMRIARRIGAVVGRARLSHEKLYDLLAVQFIKAADMAAIFDFDPYPDHVMRDKRRRQSPVESGIRALT
ncbi:MAG: IS4 family transposase [Verrucomicrobia bacterium]|nr:MAG: IS4 family transposase [Verrucomicrobiota bacterium]